MIFGLKNTDLKVLNLKIWCHFCAEGVPYEDVHLGYQNIEKETD